MNLDVERVSLTYPGSPPLKALDELSFQVPSGEFVAIIGPSGCGKSTLLRLVADLVRPTQGTIRIDGRPPAALKSERKVAWMAQSPALLPWLTARENVRLAAHFVQNHGEARLSPQVAIERVGLGSLNGEYPQALSGGMQQRIALARLLVQGAGLWLMDEPFSALDEITRESLAGELLNIWRPLQPTVLWVTHNIYEALRLADRVLVMSTRPGRIIADLPITLGHPRQENDPVFQDHLARLRAALAQAASETSQIGRQV